MGLAIHLVTRAGLVALLVGVPGGAAFALAIVDSSLTISNLTIMPASGSVSFELPSLATSATTHAFNSLGEEVFDGNSGSGTVTANAMVTFAHGTAMASTSSVSASASVNIPADGTVLAGVNVPGSDGDFSGLFDINGASTNPVNVTFSMQVSGSLDGVSDAAGFLQNGDLTAELDIDGTPVLFDFETLPGLPSVAGINNYPNTTIPISETLTATISLATGSHFFDMHADAEAQAFNIAEPGSLSLLLAGLGALAWRRRGGARRFMEHNKASRHG
jgi:hypothetical protein